MQSLSFYGWCNAYTVELGLIMIKVNIDFLMWALSVGEEGRSECSYFSPSLRRLISMPVTKTEPPPGSCHGNGETIPAHSLLSRLWFPGNSDTNPGKHPERSSIIWTWNNCMTLFVYSSGFLDYTSAKKQPPPKNNPKQNETKPKKHEFSPSFLR